MKLSPHFSLAELTVTNTGLPNEPDLHQIESLKQLCINVLEPLRHIFGPIRVTSGFRSRQVNDAIGGAPSSQHCKGEAADIVPIREGVKRDHVIGYLLASAIPVDQCIGYHDTSHAHLSYNPTRTRRQFLWHDDGGYRPFPV